MGMGSTAFTGHQSQPGDAARQPFTVIDSALSGVSALSGGLGPPGGLGPLGGLGRLGGLGPPGPLGSRASLFTRLPYIGIPPWK